MSGRATISIVSCNAQLAQRCIESVLTTEGAYELFLTANGDMAVSEYFRSLTLIRRKRVMTHYENKGFIPSNRIALGMCDTPFFVTLNDDVTIEYPEWLNKMLEPFEDEKVASVGVEGFPCQLMTPGVFRGSPGPRVDYVEMSCGAFRTSALREVEAFPEWLDFAYGEDVHTGIALARAGYTLTQVPVGVTHEGSATAKTMDLQRYKNRNHAELMRRYWDFWENIQCSNVPVRETVTAR